MRPLQIPTLPRWAHPEKDKIDEKSVPCNQNSAGDTAPAPLLCLLHPLDGHNWGAPLPLSLSYSLPVIDPFLRGNLGIVRVGNSNSQTHFLIVVNVIHRQVTVI